MNEKQFRFEDLEVWKKAARFSPDLFSLADKLDERRLFRFAEHPMYTRRYGGTPLWGDTYGVAVESIKEKLEVHGTAFVADPVIDPVQHARGAAVYAEFATFRGDSLVAQYPDVAPIGRDGLPIPRTYVQSTRDQCYPPDLQAKSTERTAAEVVALDAGHMTMVTVPERIARVEAAGPGLAGSR